MCAYEMKSKRKKKHKPNTRTAHLGQDQRRREAEKNDRKRQKDRKKEMTDRKRDCAEITET